MRNCTKCNETKKLSEFSKHKRGSHGLCAYCRDCAKVISAEWRNKNKETISHRRRQKNYGLSIDAYNLLLVSQDGVCAICKSVEKVINPKSGKIQGLSVDHDHYSGKIRGLLCARCNISLGKFEDDFNMLLAAAKYIHEHQGVI